MDQGKLAPTGGPVKPEDLVLFTTEDGEPFAVFVWGHVPLQQFPMGAAETDLEMMADEACGMSAQEWAGPIPDPGHHWIRQADKDDQDPALEDWPWNWCAEGAPGATAITGLRF